MMFGWRTLNRLFGFDYVYLSNSADDVVARVKRLPNGEVYCNPYSHQYLAIPHPLNASGEYLSLAKGHRCGGWMAVPLTPGVTKGMAHFVNFDPPHGGAKASGAMKIDVMR